MGYGGRKCYFPRRQRPLVNADVTLMCYHVLRRAGVLVGGFLPTIPRDQLSVVVLDRKDREIESQQRKQIYCVV